MTFETQTDTNYHFDSSMKRKMRGKKFMRFFSQHIDDVFLVVVDDFCLHRFVSIYRRCKQIVFFFRKLQQCQKDLCDCSLRSVTIIQRQIDNILLRIPHSMFSWHAKVCIKQFKSATFNADVTSFSN